MEIIRKDITDRPKIGDLHYGTIVTSVPNNPDCTYIKVSKKFGLGIHVNYPKGHCLLLNLKSGTIIAIDGSSRVKVLDGTLKLNEIITSNLWRYKKEDGE